MKKLFLLAFLSITFFLSCEKDNSYPAGTPTSIKGNISDHYRNIAIENLTVKLIRYRSSSPGFFPGGVSYSKEIATAVTDENGDFTLNFGYYLKDGDSYYLMWDETSPYVVESINYPLERGFTEGVENIINFNAWEPVKVKFNLTVLNNHTPPLHTGIRINDRLYGTNNTYAEEPVESFELYAPPNSNVVIDFWYLENYTSNNPILHRISYPFITGSTTDSNPLNYTIDCATF